jgi:hypothetical protein
MLLYLDFNVRYCKKGSSKIELMIYDHYTYAIVLMYDIIDAMSFAYHKFIKCRMLFMQN